MKKTAFMFPGQGAQYVGMGKELAEYYPEADQVFEMASEAIGYDMKKLCFQGPEEELKKTENTQPAILTTSMAAYNILERKGFKPEVVAGLSLGEYSALVASGSLSLQEAVLLVKARGKYMQEAVPLGQGKMAAIIGLSREKVKNICREADGVLEPANFNSPGQVVIAGETDAVEQGVEMAQSEGAKKAVVLPVSAPFHCRLLNPAGEKLAEDLEKVTINDPKIPLIANVHGDYVHKAEEIKEALIRQVSHSVYWEDSIQRMISDGIEHFVEVGPGKVLCGFVKRIDRKAVLHNVEDKKSLENLLDY